MKTLELQYTMIQFLIINNYSPKWRRIVVDICRAAKRTTFTDTEVNNCFSLYHTNWITSSLKSNFICENIAIKAILFSFGCSEVNSTWLITSELANQRARKVLFTCVVYTNTHYYMVSFASRQDDPNRALWLATRADKMEPSCPLGTTRCIPQA